MNATWMQSTFYSNVIIADKEYDHKMDQFKDL